MELPAPAGRTRPKRASAGQRSKDRVTSFEMKRDDELVLDALRAHYGDAPIGRTVLRALWIAAEAEGIDMTKLLEEHATAA